MEDARTDVEILAHTTLGWIELQRKNWEGARGRIPEEPAMNPNNGEVDYLMGTAITSEKKLEKMPQALFYFARAATYEGKGALNPDGRKQVMSYVQKAYRTYHGADDGFNDLVAEAKSAADPAGRGFQIEDARTIAQRERQRPPPPPPRRIPN